MNSQVRTDFHRFTQQKPESNLSGFLYILYFILRISFFFSFSSAGDCGNYLISAEDFVFRQANSVFLRRNFFLLFFPFLHLEFPEFTRKQDQRSPNLSAPVVFPVFLRKQLPLNLSVSSVPPVL